MILQTTLTQTALSEFKKILLRHLL